ncbi:putative non-ribosomal peptide synthetase [Gordonia effusa NBRC 100432]|uniref:Putative non-ribosomal peptide synthetase n=1 Tax=Gordonia effusa NBRC 100432 TaxID=1077974 RepID=H0R696_9ACTN|nr:non-ribosomal peptide synthetase [Gordonia effusa]GAB20597.1 putative non-ribosomal peptide synthetase [Gordonia effusa NBRC 100432]
MTTLDAALDADPSFPGDLAAEQVLPALAGQRDIYFGMQVAQDPTLYNTGLFAEFHGSIDVDRLADALFAALTKAEAMRAVFAVVEGEVHQRILPAENWSLEFVDIRGKDAHAWMSADMARPMDIENGPLSRFAVLRADYNTIFLYVKVHHLVCDGLGLIHFTTAIRDLYDAKDRKFDWNLSAVTTAELDYRNGDRFVQDRDYWLTKMGDRPEPVRLLDDDLPPGIGAVAARFDIPTEQLSVLRAVASETGVRPAVLLIAATAAFAHTSTGATDLVLALPVTGRLDRVVRTAPAMVTSVLPLRISLHPRDNLADAARKVDRALFALLSHSRFRGEDIGRALAAQSNSPRQPYRMFGLGVNVMANTTRQTIGGEPFVAHGLASGPVSDVEIQIQLRRKEMPAEVVIRAVESAVPRAARIGELFAEFIALASQAPTARFEQLSTGIAPAPILEVSGPVPPTPAIHRLRTAGIDPDGLPPRRLTATAVPGTDVADIDSALALLATRRAALRTVLARPLPILWTLTTQPAGAYPPPVADYDAQTGHVQIDLPAALIDPVSATLLETDLQTALDDLADRRHVDFAPCATPLPDIATRLTASAADPSALPQWLKIMAPGAGAARPESGIDNREMLTICRPVDITGTRRPPQADSAALLPVVTQALAQVWEEATPDELLIDLAVDLRTADDAQTTGPLQALNPVRVNPLAPQHTTLAGPPLDALRYLSPQVAAALDAATASGEIVDADILIGEYGLPTAHALSVDIRRVEGHWVVQATADPTRIRDAQAILDAVTVAVTEFAADTLIQLDNSELATLESRYGPIADVWPLAPLQEGLFYQAQVDADDDIYTAQFWLDFGHRIDADALRNAAEQLMADNPELRAAFIDHKGTPVQIIRADVMPRLTQVDLSAFDDASSSDATRALDKVLADDRAADIPLDDAPLWRMTLVRLPGGRDRLVVNRRFMLWDGWSGGLFVSRLLAYLNATAVPAREASLRDFLSWVAHNDDTDARAHWARHLDGYDEPSLVAPRAAGTTPRPPRRIEVDLGADLSERLRADARTAGVTLNTVLSTALTLTLSRVLGRTDIAYGSTVAGRPTEVPGIDTVIGLFLNTVPVRTILRPDEPVVELLRRVQDDRVNLMAYDHVRLAQLLEDSGQNALFDVLYVLQNFRTDEEERTQSALHDVVGEGSLDHTHYPLVLVVSPGADISFRLEYRDDLISPDTATGIVTRFRSALESIGSSLHSPVAAVDLTLPTDLAMQGPAHQLPHRTVAGLLADQAAATPHATALVSHAATDTGSMTYAQLDAAVDTCAQILAENGVGAETVVALAIPRTMHTVVALFAILRAGAAYLPLELDHPDERLRAIIDDAAPLLVLTHSQVAGRFAEVGLPTLLIDRLPEASGSNWVAPQVNPDSPAYVIYTSGSTGKPKGVITPYRGLTNMQLNHREKVFAPAIELAAAVGTTGQLRIAHTVSFAFDMSWEELLWLVEGHLVHVCDEDLRRDSTALVDYCREHRIDVVNVTPTYAAQLITDGLLTPGTDNHVPPLVLLGGEAVSDPVWTHLRDHPATFGYNLYGPTEYTINTLGIGTDESPTSSVGTPIWNTTAHLLDPWLRPVPTGIAGELYISGAGLARGYLGRPDLTSERFVADPFHSGGRLYRTGDLMKVRPDGNLDFLGRTDDQVKIRGYRVELGEIDAALTALPQIAGSAVIAAADPSAPDIKRLVAYVIPADSDNSSPTVDFSVVRRELSSVLPDYMVPTLFATVEAFPMTVNGKLDVAALPEPQRTTVRRAPTTDLERTLCDVFAQVLGLDPDCDGESAVGVDDDFFELGGHSMAAMKLVAAVRTATGAELAIRDLFEARTPAEIALRARLTGTATDIPVGDRADSVPLSPAQERLWVLYELDPADVSYHYGHVVRLHEPIDVDALRLALFDVVTRHESLRTVIDDSGADVRQRILAPIEIPELLSVERLTASRDAAADSAALTASAAEILTRPFDLRVRPAIRVGVTELRDAAGAFTSAIVAIGMHHIATDEWSDRPLLTDLTLAYAARVAGSAPEFVPLPVQYADYALWHRDKVAQLGDQQLAYWTEQLAVLPAELTLPRDRARVPGSPGPAATETVVIGADTRARLADSARSAGASMFMLLQAAVATLLHREGAGDDIPLGSPISGRSDPALDDLVGFFVGTQVLRADVSGHPTFGQLLDRIRTTDLAAFDNADVPFQRIVEELAPDRVAGRNPLFQVSISYLPLDNAPDQFLGIPATFEPLTAVGAKFDLAFTFIDITATGELTVALEYAVEQFDSSTVTTLLDHLNRILDAVATDPGVRIHAVELLDDAATADLLAAESGPPAMDDRRSLTELFRSTARAHPAAVALRDTLGGELSYAALDRLVDRTAARLRDVGVGQDHVVAVFMDRSIAQLVGLQAALRAGAAYLPIDADLPDDRIALILDDAGPTAVLVDEVNLMRITGFTTVPLGADDIFADHDGSAPVVVSTNPNDAAYVIYTSGSTGRPKGVVVSQRSIVNVLRWRLATYPGGFGTDDVVLAKTPAGFDGAVWELLLAFAAGASVVVAEPGAQRDPRRQAQIIAEFGVTATVFVPSVFDLFVPYLNQTPTLRSIIAGGEALTAGLVTRALVAAEHPDRVVPLRITNAYGPTETTVVVTDETLAREVSGPVPIGRPIAGTDLLVLDNSLNRVADGSVGELYVRGVALARGYLGRPDLTAAAFVADPTGEAGKRLYRTGDLVRRRDGVLYYVGRADTQVKVRGNRVELSEIEAVIGAIDGVSAAAVAVTGELLVGWVVPDEQPVEPSTFASSLAERLSAALPSYMVPAPLVILNEFPLNHTGKLDRRALPLPTQAEGAAPTTSTEISVAEAFAAVLGSPVTDVHANFFALGGHSLLAIKAINAIRESQRADLSLRVFFDLPTVAQLAAYLDSVGDTEAQSVPLVRRESTEPVLSFGQEQMLTLDALAGPSSTYNVPLLWRPSASEPIDIEVLRAAIGDVVERHEVLRTRYPRQRPELVDQPLVSVSVAADAADLAVAAGYPFDLETEIPIRVTATSDIAVLTMHHVATDEWSAAPLRADLDAAYLARLAGTRPDWAELPLQYADFAAWQRETCSGDRAQAQLDFWRTTLAGIPEELALPYDRSRPARPSGRGDGVFLRVPTELADKLRILANATGTSMFMVIQAAVAVLLSRLGGGGDIPLGTPVTVRNDPRLDKLVGYFLNTVVLRTDVGSSESTRDLLASVRENNLAAFDNRDLPFERVVEAVSPARSTAMNPLFQTMVMYVEGQLDLSGDTALPAPTTAKFDLSFDFVEDTSGSHAQLGGVIEYSTDLFDRTTVEAMAIRLESILRYMVDDPDASLRKLDIRIAAEYRDTFRSGPAPTTFAALFDAAVAAVPTARALSGSDGTRTFGELAGRVRAIASELAAQGIGAEDVVVVSLPRTVVALETIFAVLYSGAAYLPIDPSTPIERVAAMTELARPVRVIDSLNDPLLSANSVDVQSITRARPLLPEHPAYLIFTSGSTGTPKGVVVPHRGLANLFASHRRMLYDPAKERTGRQHLKVGHAWSLAFDASWQPQLWLLDGHELVIVDEDTQRDAEALATQLSSDEWDFLELTPSHLARLGEAPERMAAIGFGGEAVPDAQWQRLRMLTESDAYNLYGPTEGTVDALVARARDTEHPVIGRPVDGTHAYVLDTSLLPAPDGVDGELYLSGAGLARGYLDRGDLTAERFVADPFSADGSRMYRTGDVVRWTREGYLEYRGRGDDQVKIRGFRVELGEVEATLTRVDGVSQSLTVARDGRLIGYVVTEQGAQLDSAALRSAARTVLPDYMVPSAIVILDRFPTLPNGKIDRRNLPLPTIETRIRKPENAIEKQLCQAFADVLDLAVDTVGLDDDFTELGGDSIVAMALVSRLRTEGFTVGPRDVMTYRTAGELAEFLPTAAASTVTLEHVASGPVPALPIVRWLQELADGRPETIAGFHQSALLTVPADIDTTLIDQTLRLLLQRHHMLRARLVTSEPSWRFDIPTSESLSAGMYPTVVVETERDVHAVALRARARLDPRTGAMVSASLIDFGDEPGRLLLQIHHLVVDGVSWRTVVPEFIAVYTQLADGLPADSVSLAAAPTDYGAFVRELVGEDRSDELPQWRETISSANALGLFSDKLDPRRDVQGTARVHRVMVDSDVAQQVLGPVPAQLGVAIDDVLLGAFGTAAGTPTLVDLEGHGRVEELVPGADLSGTVGWFTAVHPVAVGGPAVPAEQARQVAERRAEFADDGIGYGLLRYLDGEQLSGAAIEFNYLGRYRSFGFDDWGMAPESADIGPGDAMPAGYGLIVDITTLDGPDGTSLRATWTYQPRIIDADAVVKLADRWLDALTEVCRSQAHASTTDSSTQTGAS